MIPANRFILRCLKELGALADVRRTASKYSSRPLASRLSEDVPVLPESLCSWRETKLGVNFYSTFYNEFYEVRLKLLGTYLSIYSKVPQLTEAMDKQLTPISLKKPTEKKTHTLPLKKKLVKTICTFIKKGLP